MLFDDSNKDRDNKIIELFNNGKTQKEIGLELGCNRVSIIKACARLGLKRSVQEAASLKKSPLDNEKTVSEIRELRKRKSLEEIAKIYNSSTSSVDRLCNKYNIKLDSDDYKKLQSERMLKSWPIERKAEIKVEQLYKHYKELVCQNLEEDDDDDDIEERVINLIKKRLEYDTNDKSIICEIIYEDSREEGHRLRVCLND